MKPLIVVLVLSAWSQQIPSAPPHVDSPENFKHKWVMDVVKGCYKQEWEDKNEIRNEFCRQAAAALANLYIDEHPELLK